MTELIPRLGFIRKTSFAFQQQPIQLPHDLFLYLALRRDLPPQ